MTTLTDSTPAHKHRSVSQTTVLNPAISSSSKAGFSSKTGRPGRNRRYRWPWLVVTIAVVLGGTAWATLSGPLISRDDGEINRFTVKPRSFSVTLKEKGELKASKSTDVICEVEGRTTIISLIPEGTAVKEGDLLVELASDKIEDRIREEELKEANAVTAYESAKAEYDIQRDKNASDIRKAELEIQLKTLALDQYEKGDWVQKLRDADIAIEQAEVALDREKEDWEAAQKLYERNFITRTEYEQDNFDFMKAQWDLEKAKLAKEVLVTYTHIADLQRHKSDLEEAKKETDRTRKNAEAEENKKRRALEGAEQELALIRDQLSKLRTQKDKCRIIAPTQGFVVYYTGGGRWWSSDDALREGSEVHERQILMQLPDTTRMMAVVRIHEAKTDKLEIGQEARITVEGVPGEVFTGKVTKIAVLADTQNRWLNPDLREYETEITLDSSDIPLKPGVTAHAEIMVETIEDRLAIPVQSVFTKAGQSYVFRGRGADVKPVSVEIGSVSTEWAEVRDGVSSGDDILLAFSDIHRRMILDDSSKGSEVGQSFQKRKGNGNRENRRTDSDKNKTDSGEGKTESPTAESVKQAETPKPSQSSKG